MDINFRTKINFTKHHGRCGVPLLFNFIQMIILIIKNLFNGNLLLVHFISLAISTFLSEQDLTNNKI